jgi:hypothetical protein
VKVLPARNLVGSIFALLSVYELASIGTRCETGAVFAEEII